MRKNQKEMLKTEANPRMFYISVVDKPTDITLGTETETKVRIIDKKSKEIISGAKVTGNITNPSAILSI